MREISLGDTRSIFFASDTKIKRTNRSKSPISCSSCSNRIKKTGDMQHKMLTSKFPFDINVRSRNGV